MGEVFSRSYGIAIHHLQPGRKNARFNDFADGIAGLFNIIKSGEYDAGNGWSYAK